LSAALCGCSSSSNGAGQGGGDASTNDAPSATFGASACGHCVATACGSAISACNATPDCQSYLACLDKCPLASDGNVDAHCAAACPAPSSNAGQQAASQLTQCRTTGAGAACASCGGTSDAGTEGGLLNEHCAPAPDAGNSCRECILEQCCDARTVCESDPDCYALLNCEVDCDQGLPDEAGATPLPPDGGMYSCDTWCNAKANPGFAKWAEYFACVNIACGGPTQCMTASMCGNCAAQHCAAQEAALYATTDGYLLYDCVNQCATGDTTCEAACFNAYPSTQSAQMALNACAQQYCPGCN
jgi:hypothetical protein